MARPAYRVVVREWTTDDLPPSSSDEAVEESSQMSAASREVVPSPAGIAAVGDVSAVCVCHGK